MPNLREALLARARAIADLADAEHRKATSQEAAEVHDIFDRVKLLDWQSRVNAGDGDGPDPVMDEMIGTMRQGDLFTAVKAAGFDPAAKPSVKLHAKDLTAPTPATDSAPRRAGGVAETGEDRRYLFRELPQVEIGDALRVDALVETSRTLPSPLSGAVLDPTGTATKPAVDSTVALQGFDTKMVAVLSGMIPNSIFQLDEFKRLVNDFLGHGWRAALDDYCVTTIYAAVTDFGVTGSDLLEQIRYGKQSVQDNGFSPNLVAVNPTDATTIDLYRGTGTDQFILNPNSPARNEAFSPLWGMRVVASGSVTDPIVLDTSVLRLYIADPRFAIDPFTAFSTNQSQARLEAPAVLVISQPLGIYTVSAS
jgi:hypothetical protein